MTHGHELPPAHARDRAGHGAAAATLRALVNLYRWFLSPWLGGHCRFHPSCSEYALEALGSHGAARGLWLVLRRLGRCHPFGGSGFDPVPPVRRDKAPRPGPPALASAAACGQRGGNRQPPAPAGPAQAPAPAAGGCRGRGNPHRAERHPYQGSSPAAAGPSRPRRASFARALAPGDGETSA